MTIIYDAKQDIYYHELKILEMGKQNGLNTDILNKIYNELDPVEVALVGLCRQTKTNLDKSTVDGKIQYQITGQPTVIKNDCGTFEVPFEIFSKINILGDNKIEFTEGKRGIKGRKTYDLDHYLNKTRQLVSKLSTNEEILQEVAKLNPALQCSIKHTQNFKNGEYLDLNPDDLTSYLNPFDPDYKTILYSGNTILQIERDGKFHFKHIPRSLTFEEFYEELERMKKLSELTKTVEDFFKEAGCEIIRDPNPSNDLLPIIYFKHGQKSYTIENELITIKTSEDKTTTKTLTEFVEELKSKTLSNNSPNPLGATPTVPPNHSRS